MSSPKFFSTAALAVGLATALFAGAADAAPKKEKKLPPSKELAAASPEQLDAYKLVFMGDYQCELGQSLAVTPHTTAGYAEVAFKRYRFTMKPVLSSTGAVRLEDVSGRTLMVQIANKSMLLDNKVGQRMVDECVNAQQKSAADAPPKVSQLLN